MTESMNSSDFFLRELKPFSFLHSKRLHVAVTVRTCERTVHFFKNHFKVHKNDHKKNLNKNVLSN